MKIVKKLKKVSCGLILMSMFACTGGVAVTVHAAGNTTVQQYTAGDQTPGQGNSQIDVDGKVKQEGDKNSQKTDSSKPSTTVDGNGLNDKLAGNAKTGEVVSSGMWIVFAAGCGVLVILAAKKRKENFSQI